MFDRGEGAPTGVQFGDRCFGFRGLGLRVWGLGFDFRILGLDTLKYNQVINYISL